MTTLNKDYCLYILMRTDLPSMGYGRAAAQASHASNAFIHSFGHTKPAKEWAGQTRQGFGTAIVLNGGTVKNISEIVSISISKGFYSMEIVDPDYVIPVSSELIPYIADKNMGKFEQSVTDPTKYFFHRSEVTCAYIFGDRTELKPILGHLSLYS